MAERRAVVGAASAEELKKNEEHLAELSAIAQEQGDELARLYGVARTTTHAVISAMMSLTWPPDAELRAANRAEHEAVMAAWVAFR